jgi:hypothetical protein
MVVKIRNFSVLVCAFDKLDVYCDFIAVINDANNYTTKELDAQIWHKFDHWIQYVFVDNQERMTGSIKCKYMFIYPEDENIDWISWKKSKGEIVPYPTKQTSMQSIYEYDNYGNILETYDKN